MIPKSLRDRLGIRAGDEVAFRLERDAVLVERVRPEGTLRGRYAGRPLLDDLEREHSREVERDEGR